MFLYLSPFPVEPLCSCCFQPVGINGGNGAVASVVGVVAVAYADAGQVAVVAAA